MPSSRRLFLFDIDGTLITSGGAGEAALIAAMDQRFGVVEDFAGISLAGATDALIARALLKKHGIEQSPENITALLDAYLHQLSSRVSMHAGRVLPGIVPLLDALKARPEAVLALLTGNLVKGAKIKLTHSPGHALRKSTAPPFHPIKSLSSATRLVTSSVGVPLERRPLP